jgi:hypothetical protein
MFTCIAGVVRCLIETFPKIRAVVQSVLEVDLQLEDIRVPLDVQRTEMRSLQWLSYMMREQTVSSQHDLQFILFDLKYLRLQTRREVPLLVDMDIHYRIMKLIYGQSVQRWNFAASLVTTPLLYGV